MGCVDITSGEVLFYASDFELPGYLPLEFERSYGSTSSSVNGSLGYGWRHNLDQRLVIEPGRVTYYEPDGRAIAFTPVAVGQESHFGPDALTLSHPAADEWVITTHDRQRRSFLRSSPNQNELPLATIADLNGNAIRFFYQDGLLTRLVDTVDRHLTFVYDKRRRLVEVRLVSDELPARSAALVRYEYNDSGDLVADYDALGQAFRYEYQYHLLVQFTNRNGSSSYFQYDRQQRCVRTWRDQGRMLREILFDDQKKANLVINSLGDATLYRFNSAGLITDEIDPLGRRTSTLYGDNNDELLVVDHAGIPVGPLIEIDDHKNPKIETDPLGNVTAFTHNALNQLTRLEDALQNVWQWEYDDRGNLISAQNARGGIWKFENDQRGNSTKTTDPGGHVTHHVYSPDLRNVTQSDDVGTMIRQEFDLLGNLVAWVDGVGHRITFERDLAGRLLEVRYPDGGFERYRYDAEGNPIGYLGQSGVTMAVEYDGWGFVVRRRYPGGRQVEYVYDTEENLVEVVNQNGDRQRYAFDACGRTVEQQFFDGRVERYEYNLRDDITAIIDSAGNRTLLEYDANSNLVVKVCPDGRRLEYDYDSLGRVIAGRVIDSVSGDTTVELEYDPHSNVVVETQNGVTLKFTYDAADNRTSVELPDGRKRRYDYDGRDRPTRIANFDGSRHEFTYDLVNRLVDHSLPNGVRKTREYGAWNRNFREQLTRADGRVLVDRAFQQDVEGKLVEVRTDGISKRYEYDPIGQLLDVLENGEPVERYDYDPCGNLTRTPHFRQLSYGPGNRLLSADNVLFQHDAQGHIVRRSGPDGELHLDYDSEGQLARLELPDGSLIRYAYDAFGRRVRKEVDGTVTEFLWEDESLLQETDEGNVRSESLFIPESFYPLTRSEDGAESFFNANDLGLPVDVFDAQGDLRSQPAYTAYGAMRMGAPDDSTPAMRFGGQYFDGETGFAYNWFRYYSPELGRYLSFDPLGTAAGFNGYQYTLNPVNWFDPFGLSAKLGPLPPYMERARSRGVARMWAAEKKRLDAGLKGTRNWTAKERQIIQSGKAPPGWEGHHKKSVKHHYHKCKKIKNSCKKKQAQLRSDCRKEAKRLAESKGNLQPLKNGQARAGRPPGATEPNEHLAAHRGNFCNATHGGFTT